MENIAELDNDVLCPDLVVFLDGTVLVPQVLCCFPVLRTLHPSAGPEASFPT